jgi:hypothetical protein
MAFNINPATTQIRYPFNGNLNPNEVFGSIYNMILFQEVYYPELNDNFGFVEMFRTEGGMYGDTALFYDQNILKSREWLGDNEAQNLLAIERPEDPECQAVVVDKFRIIKTSLDNYLSKRAWSDQNAFTTFNGIVRSMVGKTKELYEVTLINTFLGRVTGEAKGSLQSVPISDITETGEAKNRLEAQTIAQFLADLLIEMKDYSRDFNDYGFMRAYKEESLKVVWNSAYVNKINKLDLPTIFNKAGLMDKFEQYILPARYFSEATTESNVDGVSGLTKVGNSVTIGAGYGGRIITYVEGDFVDANNSNALVHLFVGEQLPVGATFVIGQAGIVDSDVICKVITKDTIKYLSGFETATEFWNPQALVTSNMLIWGFSEPTRLKGQPCVTLHAD